jgi:hypothetical protein
MINNILLIITLYVIYINSGLLSVILFLNWNINYIIITFLIENGDNNKILKILQIVHIFAIKYIIVNNLNLLIFNLFIFLIRY